jgi:hypothetical protein
LALQRNFRRVTAHMKAGRASKIDQTIRVLRPFANWYRTGEVYEYVEFNRTFLAPRGEAKNVLRRANGKGLRRSCRASPSTTPWVSSNRNPTDTWGAVNIILQTLPILVKGPGTPRAGASSLS